MWMDRRVAESLLSLLLGDGSLRAFVQEDLRVRDMQLRAAPGDAPSGRGTASVYVGMSAVLSVDVSQRGARLRTHRTYRDRTPVSLPWGEWRNDDAEVLQGRVVEFLEWAVEAVDERWIAKEGRVHAALAAHDHGSFVSVNREVSIGFTTAAERDGWLATTTDAVAGTLEQITWANSKRLGTGLDILGLDPSGRLLAIEAKPAGASSGIQSGPLQVWVYAQMMLDWWRQTSDAAGIISGMAEQRHRLGFCPLPPSIPERVEVVPVLAIGSGQVSSRALDRARTLGKALSAHTGDGLAPIELWLMGNDGRVSSAEVLS
jgi:hypothetical protein